MERKKGRGKMEMGQSEEMEKGRGKE